MQKGKRISLVLVFSSMVGACVSIDQPLDQQTLGSHKVAEKNYVLGQPLEAVVGGDIIRVKDYAVNDVATNQVQVTGDFAISGPFFSQKFRKGETYPFAGKTDYGGQKYGLIKTNGYGILFDDNGVVLDKILSGFDPANGGHPIMMIYTFDVMPGGSHLSQIVSQKEDSASTGQNYEIIFTGITSDSIRLSYREFSPDDSARSAFFQDLTYPLKSPEIVFRNLKIQILSVNGDRLRYNVLSE